MTPIGDVLALRSVVKPVASIVAAVAIAAWVTYIGPSLYDLESPKHQPTFFDARFPNQAELSLALAGDSKIQAATGLLAQKLTVGDRFMASGLCA